MSLKIHPAAADETAEAALFYNEREPHLSRDFRAEVYLAFERALSQPLVYREFEAGLRKVKVERFPYFVIFKMMNESVIQVLAVAHAKREPGYWRNRS